MDRTKSPAHGGQLRHIAAQFGVEATALLDFSANINPAGAPLSAASAIRDALTDGVTLGVYPDLELTNLKLAVARYSETQLENISVANGFVPLLDAATRALKLRRCLLPVPSFSEYRRTLENAHVDVVPYLLSHDNCFGYEPAALIKACLEYSCDAMLLANPQNPSGALCHAEQMKVLAERAAQNNIALLLDEAFVDYCPEHSLAQAATQYRSMIVFRSVTKFFALPSLRVAYAIGNSSVAKAMSRFIAPWPITSFASDAVCAVLGDHAFAEKSRVANERRRLWLTHELKRLEVVAYPSRANFLLLRFAADVGAERVLERMIVDHKVVLRSCANFEGLPAGHLRVAVRSQADNDRFIAALECALNVCGGAGTGPLIIYREVITYGSAS